MRVKGEFSRLKGLNFESSIKLKDYCWCENGETDMT